MRKLETTRLEVTSSSRKSEKTRLEVTSRLRQLEKTRLEVTSRLIQLEATRLEVTSRSRKVNKSLLEATWLERTRLEVTSRPLGSRKLGSKSLRGRDNSRKLGAESLRGQENSRQENSTLAQLARENLARGHCEVPWLEKPRLEGTSRSRKLSRSNFEVKKTCEHLGATWLARTLRTLETLDKLGSRSLQSHFEDTRVERTRLEATSRLLRNHLARETRLEATWRPLGSLGLPWLCLARFSFAQFCTAGVGSARPGLSRPAWLDSARLVSKLFEEAIKRNYSRKLSRRH